MTKDFFNRFKDHINKVSNVLKENADSASIFPNSTDIGQARENTYVEFLKHHSPTNCKVALGGFLFSQDGSESQQIDIIITNSKAPQFNWFNKNGEGKIFACVDGCIAIASIKSNLTRETLNEALTNISSLPLKQSLKKEQVPFASKIYNYDDWPYKIIYASRGASLEIIKNTLNNYYDNNKILESHKPNIIHVIGKYTIIRKYEETIITESLKGL